MLQKSHSKLLLFAFIFFASPIVNANKTTPKNLSLQKNNSSTISKKDMEKRAKNAALTYYKSLIKANYRKAGYFVHSDLMDGLRRETLNLLRQEKSEARKKAGLKSLQTHSVASLENLSDAVFFERWANSSFGFRIAVMANPKAEAKAEVENVYCYVKQNYCDVALLLKVLNQGGKVTSNRQLIRVEPEKGQWKVGASPDKVQQVVPINPVSR